MREDYQVKPISLALAVTAALSCSTSAARTEPVNEAYWGSTAGTVVVGGFGDCVRSSQWTPDRLIEGCGKVAPPPAARAVAPPPPPPAPVVIAPPPPPPPAPAVVAAPPPPPAPAVVAAPTPPKPVRRTVTLQSDALFAFGSAFFERQGQPGDLEKFAEQARGLTAIETVEVVGHTDAIGSASFNQRLSEERAEAIRQVLIKNGVNANVIFTRGLGESEPAADNATREGRAKNRRVEITIKGVAEAK